MNKKQVKQIILEETMKEFMTSDTNSAYHGKVIGKFDELIAVMKEDLGPQIIKLLKMLVTGQQPGKSFAGQEAEHDIAPIVSMGGKRPSNPSVSQPTQPSKQKFRE